MKKPSSRTYVGWVVLFLAVFVLTSCPQEGSKPVKPAPKPTPPAAAIAPLKFKPVTQADFQTVIMQVARFAMPSVVHIEVTQREEVSNTLTPFGNDPFFRFFFGDPDQTRKFKRELKGLGSGMIINPEGYIITNNHVVAGASQIEVLLASGKRYPATVIGTDPKTDLAVIKISAEGKLPAVIFGNSDKMEVGEWVVAIGHPRGLDQTVTQGIISAKHRRGITDPSSYQDFLQTDAAINPGNSGGPLLNLSGEVIGVNAAIASESGGFEGIGFAIPSNMALHVARALMSIGKVERGWLGVAIQDLTPEKAQELGLETTQGALIMEVTENGPAEKAGLKAGDVVIALNGEPVPDSGALRNAVATMPIGASVTLDIWRKRSPQKITATVGSLEKAAQALSASLRERLGVDVRPLSSAEVRKFGLDSQSGVVVSWLENKGPMAAIGFEPGDLILAANGQPIDSVDTFVAVISSVPNRGRIVLFAVDHRTGRAGNVQVRVR